MGPACNQCKNNFIIAGCVMGLNSPDCSKDDICTCYRGREPKYRSAYELFLRQGKTKRQALRATRALLKEGQ